MGEDAPTGDVLLGYLHSDELTSSFHKSLLDLIGYDLSAPRRIAGWVMVKCPSGGIPDGRNDLAQKLIDGDAEWLWMVDSDMGFHPDTLEKLLFCADPIERPMVGGLAFAQRELGEDGMNGFGTFPTPTIFDATEHDDGFIRMTGRRHYPVNSLIRCDATGGACVVIHRSVFEAMYAEFGPNWFSVLPDPSGDPKKKLGEDISFFTRATALGIPLHIHTGIRTSHYKHLWLGENHFWTSFSSPPATERVDVIVPVLHRPQNVQPLMESLRASTGLATAWFVCEADDIEEQEEVRRCGGEVLSATDAHTFAEKVNFAYGQTDASWILLCGDDVRFRAGWLDSALDVARRYRSAVVGTNDLCNDRVTRGEHATHPLISRAYIDEHGASWDGPRVVCHEGYHHWFVDDEIVTVAKQRGTFQAAMASQVEHLHPMTGKVPTDEVYELGTAHVKEDQALFASRVEKFT